VLESGIIPLPDTATERMSMSTPFIFIATNRLREGKLEAERERTADLSSFIEASEPQLLAFNEYASSRCSESSERGPGAREAQKQRHERAPVASRRRWRGRGANDRRGGRRRPPRELVAA